jgi:Ca2+-dependent lipid-binding protein
MYTVTILSAVGLRAADSNGLSDPFVKVHCGYDNTTKTIFKTTVIKKNLNPIWNHESFTVQIGSKALYFEIFDHNLLKNVKLGHVLVDDLSKYSVLDDQGKWFDVHDGGGKLNILIKSELQAGSRKSGLFNKITGKSSAKIH